MKDKAIKVKNYLLQMLNQFIPVALGVYLGIVLSNWNVESVQLAEQKEFVNNLYLEIQANKIKLEEASSYRQTIFLSAKKVRQELDQKIMQANFLDSRPLEFTAWLGRNKNTCLGKFGISIGCYGQCSFKLRF